MAVFAKKSPFTGILHEVDIPYYTQEDFETRYKTWQEGRVMIQEAFPEASADLREFLKTGITPEEFRKFVGTD